MEREEIYQTNRREKDIQITHYKLRLIFRAASTKLEIFFISFIQRDKKIG